MALEGLFRIKKLYKEDRITGSPTSQESGYPTQLAVEGPLIIEVDTDTVFHIEPVL